MKIVSVVIPVYNEAYNVVPMREALRNIWGLISKYSPEIIFVDDGSKDETWTNVISLTSSDKNVH
jgi:polyisoprenyl-phosphate glycosyltransferase